MIEEEGEWESEQSERGAGATGTNRIKGAGLDRLSAKETQLFCKRQHILMGKGKCAIKSNIDSLI